MHYQSLRVVQQGDTVHCLRTSITYTLVRAVLLCVWPIKALQSTLWHSLRDLRGGLSMPRLNYVVWGGVVGGFCSRAIYSKHWFLSE